jgi:signal transduction histidine kinase
MTELPLILLVDDEPDILVALEDLFEGQYRVLTAGSGREGLKTLAANPDVAVIVSDQRMPEMTGDVFLGQARAMSDAAAILLTGYADLTAVVAALNEGGIVGYASKPWEPEGLRAMVAGAAEQRRLRRALAREQALLRGLMDHIPAEIAFKDRDGRHIQVNNRKAEAMRAKRHGPAGLSAEEVDAIRSGQPLVTMGEQVTAAGVRWFETETVPIADEGGEVKHLAVISRDVTPQKIAEIQLRQSDKLRALGTLAGGVAHDFNNLLTVILGSLDLASRKLGDEAAVRKYLDNATKAAQRSASLTQRLLGFSRQTENRAGLVELPAVLANAHDLMIQALGPGFEVVWNIADDLWPAVLEPDELELALLNLAVNARDAMGASGEIAIGARNTTLADTDSRLGLAAGDYVVLIVEDTGEGMTPETLSRVTEPFFTTKPPGKGTGLGLSIVYGFVQRLGGALDIASQIGEGTQIVIYLPRGDTAVGAALLAAPSAAAADDRKLCVLVVDDEALVRDVTADFLRELGHEVLEAANGQVALELFNANRDRIDLAIVDFAMPGMNGVDLAIAARTRRPDLPVILLTGYYDLDAVPTDISIMRKPFTDKGLLEAISAAVQVRD